MFGKITTEGNAGPEILKRLAELESKLEKFVDVSSECRWVLTFSYHPFHKEIRIFPKDTTEKRALEILNMHRNGCMGLANLEKRMCEVSYLKKEIVSVV